MQPSHLPLLTLIVAPEVVGLSENLAVPEEPVVDVGAPPHLGRVSDGSSDCGVGKLTW